MCFLGFSILLSHRKQEPTDPEEFSNILSQKQSTFLVYKQKQKHKKLFYCLFSQV